ncbi:MAG: hypothetical protein M1302_05360, partial [Candidatus Thermoplasmatota archaeon]|nr:hypothetical protein [Candidatus Thermoplasmatota archaeon]
MGFLPITNSFEVDPLRIISLFRESCFADILSTLKAMRFPLHRVATLRPPFEIVTYLCQALGARLQSISCTTDDSMDFTLLLKQWDWC